MSKPIEVQPDVPVVVWKGSLPSSSPKKRDRVYRLVAVPRRQGKLLYEELALCVEECQQDSLGNDSWSTTLSSADRDSVIKEALAHLASLALTGKKDQI